MPSFGVALAWMVISPVSFLTDLLGVLILLHYRTLFHSCDVAFISILVTMTTNSLLLLPVPAVIKLGNFYWNKKLCTIYTWLSITLRSSHLMVLLVLNVYWMASLRMSQKGRIFATSKPMKISVCLCWFISAIAGLIPVTGGSEIFHFYENEACTFLPANVGGGFAIFFVIASLLSAVMGIVSTLDTLMLLRSMNDVALTKHSARQLRLPTVSGTIHEQFSIQTEHTELGVSIELCRLVLCFSVASAVLNSIPLMVTQFVQLIQAYDRQVMETTLLSLLLAEASTLPHILWSLGGRYRHATVYTWRVFVLRDRGAVEGDAAACSLQAYRLRVKDMSALPSIINHRSTKVNGAPDDADDAEFRRTEVPNREGDSQASGPIGQSSTGVTRTTGLEADLTAMTQMTSTEVVFVHRSLELDSRRTVNGGQTLRSHVLDTPLSSRLMSASQQKSMTSFKAISSSTETMRSSTTISRALSQETSFNSNYVNGQITHDMGRCSFGTNHRGPTQERGEIIKQDRLSFLATNNTAYVQSTVEPGVNAPDFCYPLDNSETYANCVLNIKSTNSQKYPSDYTNVMTTIGTENTFLNNVYENGIISNKNIDWPDTKHYYLAPKNQSELNHVLPHRLSKNQFVQSQTIILRPKLNSIEACPATVTNHNHSTHQRVLGVYYDDTHTIVPSQHLTSHHSLERKLTLKSIRPETLKRSLRSPRIKNRRHKKFTPLSNLVVSKVDSDVTRAWSESVRTVDGDVTRAWPEGARTVDGDVAQAWPEGVRIVGRGSVESRRGQDGTWPKAHSGNTNLASSELNVYDKEATTWEPHEAVPQQRNAEQGRRLNLNDVSSSGKLEPVGGSELLHLKIRSIRAAMAVYCSDDTTSDEWDIDATRSDNDA